MSFPHVLAVAAVLYGGWQALSGNTWTGLAGLALAGLLLWIAPRRR